MQLRELSTELGRRGPTTWSRLFEEHARMMVPRLRWQAGARLAFDKSIAGFSRPESATSFSWWLAGFPVFLLAGFSRLAGLPEGTLKRAEAGLEDRIYGPLLSTS